MQKFECMKIKDTMRVPYLDTWERTIWYELLIRCGVMCEAGSERVKFVSIDDDDLENLKEDFKVLKHDYSQSEWGIVEMKLENLEAEIRKSTFKRVMFLLV